ncbi:multidrug effflux MFS transporter, partial [Shewanella frigidimarina]
VQQTSLPAPYAVAMLMGSGAIVLLAMMAMPKLDHWHQEQHAY